MAIYHLSVTPISRSDGRSATAAAAYRAAVKIVDPATGEIHDYRRKRGVDHTQLLMPDTIAAAAPERSSVWGAAELAEKRCNARVAREVRVALPDELTPAERQALAVEFSQHLANRYQIAVDCSIHQPDRHGDARNHHAHLLLTTRTIDLGPDGSVMLGSKVRVLDDRTTGPLEVEWMREQWASVTNKALQRSFERAGHQVAAPTIDHRSYARQGVDRMATVHLGPKWSALERRGISTRRGRRNKRVADRNTAAVNRLARIAQLKAQVAELAAQVAEAGRQAVDAVKAALSPRVDRNPKIAAARAAARDRAPANETVAPRRPGSPVPIDEIRKVAATYKKTTPMSALDPLADLSHSEIARRYLELVQREEKIRAAAAGIPIEQFQELSYADQINLSGGTGLPAQDTALLNALEARLERLQRAPNPTTPTQPPAPKAPVPSASPPPRVPEREMTDDVKAAALKAIRDRGPGR